MAAVQLNFSLRTSSSVKTVHLVGSWDSYTRQLPLSKDTSKSGAWAGKFRFQTSAIQLGGRYWYYYIMDGYHVSHDPAVDYTVEPTTGRKLNILDVPGGKSSTSSRSSTRRESAYVPTGRALSPSRIQHPKPSKPYASRGLREGNLSNVDELADRFASSRLSDSYSSSPPSSMCSSRSSRTGSSSPSSISSLSDPATPTCRCKRYGITRNGDRVKIDCGGSRCGYSDSSEGDSCSSESESDQEYIAARRGARRQGIVVRR